jgi:hypothetical protein
MKVIKVDEYDYLKTGEVNYKVMQEPVDDLSDCHSADEYIEKHGVKKGIARKWIDNKK